jgi:hypothetical protein
MAGFSRINPDVIDLGTTQVSGATSRLFASSRNPWDGSIAGATMWDVSTPYLIGNVVVYQGFHYVALTNHTGTNPDTDTSGRTVENGTDWKAIDGKDGDIWIKVSGASSAVLQKTNNAWNLLGSNFAGAGISLNDSAVADTAFSFDMNIYKTAMIEYYMVAPGGVIERGRMNIVNNGSAVNGSVFDVQSVGGSMGIDFDFQLDLLNSAVDVNYDSDPTPTGRMLYYILRA